MLASTTWIWHTSAWITAAGAGLLLLWGLFQNRSRGRKRCPKCWYALDDVPNAPDGWRCPECGRLTTREKRLHRTRRRWWTVVPAALAFLGTYALWATPRAQREGWTGFVPTTVLVMGVRHWERTYTTHFPGLAEPLGVGPSSPPPPPPPPPPRSTRQRLYESLESRIFRNDLWTWQSMYLASLMQHGDADAVPGSAQWIDRYSGLLDRALSASKEASSARTAFERAGYRAGFRLRERYVAGAPLHALWRPFYHDLRGLDQVAHVCTEDIVRHQRWLYAGMMNWAQSHPWDDYVVELASDASRFSGTAELRFFDAETYSSESGMRLVKATSVRLPARVDAEIGEILTPVESEALRERLIKQISTAVRSNRLELFTTRASGYASDEFQAAIAHHVGLTIALRVEILQADTMIFEDLLWWRVTSALPGSVHLTPSYACDLYITPEERAAIRTAAREGPLTLRLTGDPIVALRDMESTHYWQGQIEVPFVP